jgi:radical SAM superfamily enzyme YgiQ (UPF0313 family)
MQKKVMLIFPPEWVPTAPYLALPSITAVLRQNGIEVVQKDVNVEAFDHFFSRPFLEFVRDKIKGNLKELRHKSCNGGLAEAEEPLLQALEQHQYVDLDHHIHKVLRGKKIMRSAEFYDVDKNEWALNAFREVMDFISLAYYPASINFYPVESNLNKYRPWVSEDLLTAPEDDKVNVFVDVCRQLVFPTIDAEQPSVVGVSIGTPVQLMSGITFCKLIKQRYPGIHIVVGGNVITRLKDKLAGMKRFFAEAFDSMIVYEGEHAMVQLVRALAGELPMADVPNCIWRDAAGEVRVNSALYTERVNELPIPDFDGLPWEKYFSPEKLVPYLGTRGCYWGKCTFCDHGAGYIDQYRAKHAGQIADELEQLARKHDARHFIFTDESFPPALFAKLPPLLIERKLDIFWTTLIRFESSLLDPALWDCAWRSGCRSLYFGLESANERIIKLVKKDTRIDAAIKNLEECKRVGIWTHVMGFYGFPTETQDEGEDTRRFLLRNREIIDSVEMYFFVLYRNAPIWKSLDDLRVKVVENPEHDLALDFYYTPENGITIPEAMQRYEDFYKNDFDPWALRINAREHVFLYITRYGTKDLPQLYVKNHPESQAHLAPEVMM